MKHVLAFLFIKKFWLRASFEAHTYSLNKLLLISFTLLICRPKIFVLLMIHKYSELVLFRLYSFSKITFINPRLLKQSIGHIKNAAFASRYDNNLTYA